MSLKEDPMLYHRLYRKELGESLDDVINEVLDEVEKH